MGSRLEKPSTGFHVSLSWLALKKYVSEEKYFILFSNANILYYIVNFIQQVFDCPDDINIITLSNIRNDKDESLELNYDYNKDQFP